MVKTEELYRINYKHCPVIELETDIDQKVTSANVLISIFILDIKDASDLIGLTISEVKMKLIKSAEIHNLKFIRYTFTSDDKNTKVTHDVLV